MKFDFNFNFTTDPGPISTLPYEIKDYIFSFLSSADLRNVSLVCRQWGSMTRGHLLRRTVVKGYNQLILMTKKCSFDIRSFIQELTFTRVGKLQNFTLDWILHNIYLPDVFPNLHTLRFIQLIIEPSDKDIENMKTIIPSHMQNLTIKTLIFKGDWYLRLFLMLIGLFPNLDNIDICDVAFTYYTTKSHVFGSTITAIFPFYSIKSIAIQPSRDDEGGYLELCSWIEKGSLVKKDYSSLKSIKISIGVKTVGMFSRLLRTFGPLVSLNSVFTRIPYRETRLQLS
ncbi:hypothetical protein ABKN59_003322 [Abortiporus biennis]